jgi:hypothetical protein
MANITNVHTRTFSHANTILSILDVMSGELVQLVRDVVSVSFVIVS